MFGDAQSLVMSNEMIELILSGLRHELLFIDGYSHQRFWLSVV